MERTESDEKTKVLYPVFSKEREGRMNARATARGNAEDRGGTSTLLWLAHAVDKLQI